MKYPEHTQSLSELLVTTDIYARTFEALRRIAFFHFLLNNRGNRKKERFNRITATQPWGNMQYMRVSILVLKKTFQYQIQKACFT